MEELKLIEIVRNTKGQTREAFDAILKYRRGLIDERRMIIAVTENKHRVFRTIPKFFGGCDDNIRVAKVLQQLIYSRSNRELNMLAQF